MNQLPTAIAKFIANILDKDPIAAAQVKEHLKPERILELLALDASDLARALPPSNGPDDDDEDEDDDVRV